MRHTRARTRTARCVTRGVCGVCGVCCVCCVACDAWTWFWGGAGQVLERDRPDPDRAVRGGLHHVDGDHHGPGAAEDQGGAGAGGGGGAAGDAGGQAGVRGDDVVAGGDALADAGLLRHPGHHPPHHPPPPPQVPHRQPLPRLPRRDLRHHEGPGISPSSFLLLPPPPELLEAERASERDKCVSVWVGCSGWWEPGAVRARACLTLASAPPALCARATRGRGRG
eukprot:2763648-Rhodomonas_salina.1